ncbi:MAG: noncanonical pyrimidine nucleotidase, YjjG family [Flavobacteriia bacterium]|nr:MAG: noncanonical pyrimidine nucleotidase, YjjG family [Flavobacteriia bacterium]
MNKPSNKIKHIFFDLDHTLWDFETNSGKTFEYIFKKYEVGADISEFMKVYKPINHNYWKLYREDKITKSKLRFGRLKDAFDKLNFEVSDELIDLLAEEYINYLPFNNALFEGAHEILSYLKPKYKMHIITNGFEEVQHKKMNNANLLEYFDKIITSEEVGVKKPNPRIFEYALEKAQALQEESMMIGDNFEADILGARNVGMQTIFCKFNGETSDDKTISVTRLSEIRQYL